jgi:hypothetical protein
MKDKYVILKDITPNDLQYAVNKYIGKGYEPHGPLIQFEGYVLQAVITHQDFDEVEEVARGKYLFTCPKCSD